jgi:hypothetical protein
MNAGDRFEFFDREDYNEITDNNKCDYHECKNYRDGKLDNFCESCDNCKTKETVKTPTEDTEKFAVDFTEELLGKPLNADEKSVIKDCLNTLNKLFEQTEKKSETKKSKK